MANNRISYTSRDYQSIRTELLNYAKTYYPDLTDGLLIYEIKPSSLLKYKDNQVKQFKAHFSLKR